SGRESGDGSKRVRTHLDRRLVDYGAISRRSGRAQDDTSGTSSHGRGNCSQASCKHKEIPVVPVEIRTSCPSAMGWPGEDARCSIGELEAKSVAPNLISHHY